MVFLSLQVNYISTKGHKRHCGFLTSFYKEYEAKPGFIWGGSMVVLTEIFKFGQLKMNGTSSLFYDPCAVIVLVFRQHHFLTFLTCCNVPYVSCLEEHILCLLFNCKNKFTLNSNKVSVQLS